MPGIPVVSVMLSRALIYLGRGVSSLLDREIRPLGLAEAEFRVLTVLFSQPEGAAHPGDLCSATSQTPANMSRLSDSLLAHNYITRELSAHDRRRLVLRITPQGEEVVRRLMPSLFDGLARIFADVTPDAQRQLLAQLKSLGMHLDRELVQSAAEQRDSAEPTL